MGSLNSTVRGSVTHRECEALHLEIIVQPLLDDIEHLLLLTVRLNEVWDVGHHENLQRKQRSDQLVHIPRAHGEQA